MRNFQIIVFISTQTYGEIFKSSVPLNLGTFQLKPLQGGHLSKADKNFCPVSVRLREIPLYKICSISGESKWLLIPFTLENDYLV